MQWQALALLRPQWPRYWHIPKRLLVAVRMARNAVYGILQGSLSAAANERPTEIFQNISRPSGTPCCTVSSACRFLPAGVRRLGCDTVVMATDDAAGAERCCFVEVADRDRSVSTRPLLASTSNENAPLCAHPFEVKLEPVEWFPARASPTQKSSENAAASATSDCG